MISDVVVVAGLLFLQWKAVRSRYDMRYLPPSAFRALMALAEVLVLREDREVAPAEVASRLSPLEPEARLDLLQAPIVAEGVERVEEVRVELFESELRPPRLEEREVEARPIERHEHRDLRDCGGELVKVDALDELPGPPAIVKTHDRDVVARPPEPRRLDVEEGGAPAPFPDRPPLVPRAETAREVAVVPLLEPRAGPLDLLPDRGGPLAPAAEGRSPLQEIVPRAEPLPPQPGLRRIADPRRVDERVLEHSRGWSNPRPPE